jgi:prevent-host-death family protein
MTRSRPLPAAPAAHAEPTATGRWPLQDAKARFSELVRMAHSVGPQHVTLHGRDAVVVLDAEAFQRLLGRRTGQMLIDALQASPHRHVDIAPSRRAMPVRAVKL